MILNPQIAPTNKTVLIFCESVCMFEWTPSSWILSRLVVSWPFLPTSLFLEYLINVFCAPSLERVLYISSFNFSICIWIMNSFCMICAKKFFWKFSLLLFAPFHQIPIVPPPTRNTYCKNLWDFLKKCNQMQKVLISTQPHQIQHLIKCESNLLISNFYCHLIDETVLRKVS